MLNQHDDDQLTTMATRAIIVVNQIHLEISAALFLTLPVEYSSYCPIPTRKKGKKKRISTDMSEYDVERKREENIMVSKA